MPPTLNDDDVDDDDDGDELLASPHPFPVPPPLYRKRAREIVLRCRKHHCVCKMRRHVLRILPWGPFYGIYRGSLCKLSKSQPGSSPSTEGPCVEGANRPAPEAATSPSHLQRAPL